MLFVFLTLLPFVPSFVYATPVHLTSLTDSIKGPVRVALDTQGNLYVSDTLRNSLLIYNRKGEFQKSLNIPGPIGVVVDPAGKIYIGSEGRHSVDVYNPDLSFLHSLRTGQGETAKIARPNSIAIDAAGRIYVVDSINDTVKVFDPSGTLAFSFGSTGNTDGLFNKPTAVAISDAAGEVYVTDLQVTQKSSGLINGARIQVFDKNGAFKRSFGQYGINVGQIATPVDIAVDRAGTLYVVDSFQRVVHIIDPAVGASLGGIYDLNKPFETPQGVAIGRNNLVYVTSYAGKSVEVYALDDYVTMETSIAEALTFQGRQYGSNPASKAIAIANSGSGILKWTATADKPWITLDQASRSTNPGSSSNLSVGINLAGLASGAYTGNVIVTSDFGQTDTIAVALTVLPAPTVSFSSDHLTFTAKEGTKPYPRTVSVTLQNAASLSWTIVPDSSCSSWLSITPPAGNNAAPVSVSVNTSALSPGVYNGHASIQAPGAVGSAMTVNLTITAFSKTTEITSKKKIITAKGPGPKNSALIKTYKADGTASGLELTAFEALSYGANVTAADIDGDGVAELIVGAGPGPQNPALVHIYRADGTPMLEFTPFDSKYGVNVAAADLNGDGQAEIIVSPGPGPKNPATIKVYAYNKDKNEMMPTGIEFTACDYSYGANIAVADTEGDGLPELITAPGPGPQNPAEVKIWKLDTAKDMGKWTVDEDTVKQILLPGNYGANIAAGDTDGNGTDEIIVGAGPDPTAKAEVSIFTADGTEQKRFTAFDTYKYGVNVAAADLDGDGIAEIVTGAGPDPSPPAPKAQANNNRRTFRLGFIKFSVKRSNADSVPPAEQTVKIFSASGERKYTLKPYEDTAYGVKVATGDLGL